MQENVTLQQRGDVTVDATLKAGDIKESVTVTAEANVVQFNTGKLETTVDSKLTNSVPQLYRTPFLLAQLDPAVEKSDSQSEYMPYHSWGPNTPESRRRPELYCGFAGGWRSGRHRI